MSGTIFHGGGVVDAAAHYGRPVSEWLDLSTGINPCPPDLPALAPDLWHRLPDKDLMLDARRAAARYYGSGDLLPIAAAGTQPLIRLLAGMADKSRRVAILSPTYGEYSAVFSRAGFAVDTVTSLADIGEAHGVVIVVNPNNPDGRCFSRADLLALALQLSRVGTMLIVDEAFGDLTPGLSLAGQVAHNPHLVVLRSFGKFFGYAGLRLSFAIAGNDTAAALEEGLGPWPVSGPALSIATALFAADAHAIRAKIEGQHAALAHVLASVGLEIVGGTGLYVLIALENAAQLHDHLCRHAILTRKFDYDSRWLRIGLCKSTGELERLTDALQEWLISA